MSRYWFRAHGWGLTGWRIWFAASFGPLYPPAFYVAPKWKRAKWHRIACDSESCVECRSYYDELAKLYPLPVE